MQINNEENVIINQSIEINPPAEPGEELEEHEDVTEHEEQLKTSFDIAEEYLEQADEQIMRGFGSKPKLDDYEDDFEMNYYLGNDEIRLEITFLVKKELKELVAKIGRLGYEVHESINGRVKEFVINTIMNSIDLKTGLINIRILKEQLNESISDGVIEKKTARKIYRIMRQVIPEEYIENVDYEKFFNEKSKLYEIEEDYNDFKGSEKVRALANLPIKNMFNGSFTNVIVKGSNVYLRYSLEHSTMYFDMIKSIERSIGIAIGTFGNLNGGPLTKVFWGKKIEPDHSLCIDMGVYKECRVLPFKRYNEKIGETWGIDILGVKNTGFLPEEIMKDIPQSLKVYALDLMKEYQIEAEVEISKGNMQIVNETREMEQMLHKTGLLSKKEEFIEFMMKLGFETNPTKLFIEDMESYNYICREDNFKEHEYDSILKDILHKINPSPATEKIRKGLGEYMYRDEDDERKKSNHWMFITLTDLVEYFIHSIKKIETNEVIEDTSTDKGKWKFSATISSIDFEALEEMFKRFEKVGNKVEKLKITELKSKDKEESEDKSIKWQPR